jgi:hypothetical protein
MVLLLKGMLLGERALTAQQIGAEVGCRLGEELPIRPL